MPGSVDVVIRFALAAVLVWSAGAKLARPRDSRDALVTYGIPGAGLRALAWAGIVVAELALAAGVAAGVDAAAYAAAGMMVAFAAALGAAIARGAAGQPCGCFSPRARIGWPGVARNVGLAAAFAVVPSLPDAHIAAGGWLAIGLGVALAACAALAAGLLALYREVGILRMQLGPQSALEVPEEGPELGGKTALIERFDPGPRAELALAVFLSDGCHVCRTLEPAIAAIASEPVVSVRSFDEDRDAEVWQEADAPGSPFAVVIGRDGIVLAKGTFNNLAQLEGLLATGERRRAGLARGRPIRV